MKKTNLIRKLVILLNNLSIEKNNYIRLASLIKLYGSTTSAYFILNYLVRNEIAIEDKNEEGIYYVNLEKLREHINELTSA